MCQISAVFDVILGLPIHPLIVHAVVVLLPLSAVTSVVAVVRRGSSRWLTMLIVAAIITFGMALVAEQSGEALASRVGEPEAHAEYGEMVKFGAFGLFFALALAWSFERSRKLRRFVTLGKALVVLAATGAIAITVLAGHSGAAATWSAIIENTVPQGTQDQ